jgi:hypothetical protein
MTMVAQRGTLKNAIAGRNDMRLRLNQERLIIIMPSEGENYQTTYR